MKNPLFKLLMDETQEGGEGSAAVPAPQESSAPVEPAAPQDTDWSDMADEGTSYEDFEAGLESPEAPDEVQSAQPETPAQPVEQQAATPEEPVQPEVTAPEQPAQQPLTAEQAQQARQAYMSQLEGLYKFDEDTALRLQTEPENVLPALAARLHVDVLDNVMRQMQGLVPAMLQNVTQTNEREAQARTSFYGRFPELAKHEAEVLKIGQMFRAANPNADPETAIQRIGDMTMYALGLKREAPAAVLQQPAQSSAPFRPSAPGRTGAPQTPPNEWTELIEEDD